MISKNIEFTVRTPLFLGGVSHIDYKQHINPRTNRQEEYEIKTQEALLSGTAFRGLLRWWLRCWYGYTDNMIKVKDEKGKNKPINELALKEAHLFGSSESFESSIETHSFKLLINPSPSLQAEELPIWQNQIQVSKRYGFYYVSDRHRRDGRREQYYNGLKYFSLYLFNRANRNPQRSDSRNSISQRAYFDPDSNFQLSVKIIADTEKTLQKVIAVMWLAFQFGGIGARSRRCFGNLEFMKDDNNKYYEIKRKINGAEIKFKCKNTFDNQDDYKKTLKYNFKVLNDLFHPLKNPNNKAPYLKSGSLYLSPPIRPDGWAEAISFAGATMQFFRAKSDPDYNELRDICNVNRDEDVFCERAIFGLPLQYRFSDAPNVRIDNYHDSKPTRLASPVLVSITKIGNKYRAQYLICDFDYSTLKLKANDTNIYTDDNGISDFKEYLNDPKSFINDLAIEDPDTLDFDLFKYQPHKMKDFFE
ncbi:MAG: RAMP superfamily CRISPR-associated protein [Candidatus Hatepunaea meridiana]|nr:RAMP superfamily CRISPR-associated protein [Candidatus Hatepunaea meridiana]